MIINRKIKIFIGAVVTLILLPLALYCGFGVFMELLIGFFRGLSQDHKDTLLLISYLGGFVLTVGADFYMWRFMIFKKDKTDEDKV